MRGFFQNFRDLNHHTTRNIILFIITSFIFLMSYNLGIFWDNVLFVSKIGNILKDNGIFPPVIQGNLDPGHPPFIGILYAITWKYIGTKLWLSHLILMPFVFGLLFQLHKLCTFYFSNIKMQWLAFLMVLAEPTLFSQLCIIGPEVIQLFFLLWAINALNLNKRKQLTIALALLGIVSFRGMMLCAGVAIFDFCKNIFISKERRIITYKKVIPYIIGSIPAITFLIWHRVTQGFIFHNPNSPWANTSNFVDLGEFIRNVIVLAHRYLDYGKVALFIFLIVIAITNRKQLTDNRAKELILYSFTITSVITFTSICIVNPMGHRYFIASYMGLVLLAMVLLDIINWKYTKIIYTVIFFVLVSGHFWIYPKQISQGWDASLAHKPYFKLRKDAINFLNNNDIEISKVATFFPNIAPINYIDLGNDSRSFIDFTGSEKYILYSNVYNLTDEELALLDHNYKVIYEKENFGVFIQILKVK